MFRPASLLVLSLFIVCCTPGRDVGAKHHPDLTLTGLAMSERESPAIFTNYRADGPVSWSQGWTWKLDLTGIAWDRSNTATVITPRHVVMAAHYIRPIGEKLIFHDRKGRDHIRRLTRIIKFAERGAPQDIAVGLLDRPLPSSIRAYALPAPSTDPVSLVGTVALVTNQTRSIHFHQISRISQLTISFRYDPRFDDTKRRRLVAGDSGHPSFLLCQGELLLIETHTGGGAGTGPYYGSDETQKTLRSIVHELDPTYSFKTVAIDRRTLKDATTGRATMPQPERLDQNQTGLPRPRVTQPGT